MKVNNVRTAWTFIPPCKIDQYIPIYPVNFSTFFHIIAISCNVFIAVFIYGFEELDEHKVQLRSEKKKIYINIQ